MADSSRLNKKKLMQGYFEKKLHIKKEEKRLRLNTDRGMNFHRFTDMRYKDGALNVSKEGVKKYTSEESVRPQLSHHSKEIKKQKLSYDEIMKARAHNPEFGTGKKYKRSKGSSKKLNKRR